MLVPLCHVERAYKEVLQVVQLDFHPLDFAVRHKLGLFRGGERLVYEDEDAASNRGTVIPVHFVRVREHLP